MNLKSDKSKNMLKFLMFLLGILSTTLISAQTSGDVYMVDMSGTLPIVLAFYLITFVSLGFMLLKLLRPKFPSYWLYISCTIGIIGGAVVTWAFNDVQEKQLPKIEYSEVDEKKLSPEIKEKLALRRREVENQRYANFWIITIPNIIILGLGIFSDLNNRRRDPNMPRGRYD
jgi:hypothetical protein